MPKKHQILVDSIIVNLIPMKVEYMDKAFKPSFLMFVGLELVKNRSNFLATRLLVLWFIRVPDHYMNYKTMGVLTVEKAFPNSPDVLG